MQVKSLRILKIEIIITINTGKLMIAGISNDESFKIQSEANEDVIININLNSDQKN